MALNTTQLAIATKAVVLLTEWKWSVHGEPLAVLGLASKMLYGKELHSEIAAVRKAEQQFAPAGALSNNVEVRLNALRAVVKFCG